MKTWIERQVDAALEIADNFGSYDTRVLALEVRAKRAELHDLREAARELRATWPYRPGEPYSARELAALQRIETLLAIGAT